MTRARPALLAAMLLATPCCAQPAPLLDEVMARLAQPAQRSAGFVEEKRIAALNTPLRSTGRLSFRKPDHLEKITDSPPEHLTVDGNRLVIDTGAGAPQVVELDNQPELLALVDTIRAAVSGDLPMLRRLYDVTATGSLADWHLLLRPRSPALAKLVSGVRVDGGAELTRIESTSANGDVDTLTVTP